MSASPNNAGDGAGGNADEKPRLTEEEKKQNHIASGKSATDWALQGIRLAACVLIAYYLYRTKKTTSHP